MRTATLLSCLLLASRALASEDVHVAMLDSYGRPGHFEVRGRVRDEERADPPSRRAGPLHNLKDNLEVLDTDGVEGVHVKVTVGALSREVVTDNDGAFTAVFDGEAQAPVAGIHVARAEVAGKDGVAAEGPLYLLPDTTSLVIVSDVDDTIVQTNVRSRGKMKLVGTVLFKNAAQLEPVPGAPLAYRNALAAGAHGVIYLSGSPQGFHDRIRDYLQLQEFPGGPVLLKDFSRESPLKQEGYKKGRLDALAALLPQARFILVGDSGEKDPEIYRAFAAANPGRVVGVVVRQTPDAPAGRERLKDCRVLQDHQAQPDLLGAMVRQALAPTPAPTPAAP
jgi:phosphatidate phosphatase APP1